MLTLDYKERFHFAFRWTFQFSFGTPDCKCIFDTLPRKSCRMVTLHRFQNLKRRSLSLVKMRSVCSQWTLVCERGLLASVAQFFYLSGILTGGALCRPLLIRWVSFLHNTDIISALNCVQWAGLHLQVQPKKGAALSNGDADHRRYQRLSRTTI